MTSRPASSTTAIPTIITLLAIALGAFIGVMAGRDPLMLYLITTPFAVFVMWLSRGVGETTLPAARRDAAEASPERDHGVMPAVAQATK